MEKIMLLFILFVCALVEAQSQQFIQEDKNELVVELNNENGTERTILWKIESETKKIDHYDLHKATAIFEGRTLTAWFIVELDTPGKHYKLGGLPGAVVYVEDGQKDFVYKKNLKKINSGKEKVISS